MAKPSISKLKKKLMILVKARIILRDESTCQYCGQVVEGSNRHVSHVIPVSHGNALAFDETNMKILCYHHHLNFWHKNPIEAGKWFVDKFPERWEYLEAHKNDIVHWKLADYQRMIDDLS